MILQFKVKNYLSLVLTLTIPAFYRMYGKRKVELRPLLDSF